MADDLTLSEIVDKPRSRHTLVYALVAPIGAQVDSVSQAIRDGLQAFGYETVDIRLADLLDRINAAPWTVMPKRGDRDYYSERMNGGDEFRTKVGHGSALAALAVSDIHDGRKKKSGKDVAFLIRSIKHPAEEVLLRRVYGDAFRMIAVSTPAEERRESLVEKLHLFDNSNALADELLERDEKDQTDPLGQNVRGVYPNADAFVDASRGREVLPQVRRILDLQFGAPFETPTRVEEGMRLAFDASLRSAAIGRQVGAAIVPKLGTPILIGTNEVPRPGGGQFWAGDTPDFRDFQTGIDPNPLYSRRVVQEILESLQKRHWLVADYDEKPGSELLRLAAEAGVLVGSRAAALIEFVRCLHAEQAAIANAARAGVSIAGATLFTTTFPCHECAKMIIGAGIEEVFYVEPYAKSMVARLYKDLIDVSPRDASKTPGEGSRIPFRQFAGLSPRWYAEAFAVQVGARGTDETVAVFDRSNATPRTTGWNEGEVAEMEATVIPAILKRKTVIEQGESKGPAKPASSRKHRINPEPMLSGIGPGAEETAAG
jgi:deoxycytidylate deaminase